MTLRPATPEELASSLRTAQESSTRVARVDLSSLAQVLDHSPEDMTVTVEAGCTLAALQQALAARGQWLPIDPPHPGRLTLATLLDSNASGPRRCGHGTIREHLIGLRVALADGRLIRSGGKVVKNVAGYDLMKLFIGAQGTLGVIVEATFKLLPLPETEAFIQCPGNSLDQADSLLHAVLDSDLTPTVLDLHTIPPSAALRPPHAVVLGFAGSRAAVDWQLGLAAGLGFTQPASLAYDTEFHEAELPTPARTSVLPSRLIETLRTLGEMPFVARAANGVIYHRTLEHRAQERLDPTGEGAPALKLMRRVKETFDPRSVFPDIP